MAQRSSFWQRIFWTWRTLPLISASRRYGPAFDSDWYTACYNEIRDLGINPLQHYLLYGRAEGRAPNGRVLKGIVLRAPLARFAWLLDKQADVIESSNVFDRRWYSARYGVKGDPIRHYLIEGAYEGCDPNPFFSTASYYATNGDVAHAGVNALFHYIAHGYNEGRLGALPQRHISAFALDEKMWLDGVAHRVSKS